MSIRLEPQPTWADVARLTVCFALVVTALCLWAYVKGPVALWVGVGSYWAGFSAFWWWLASVSAQLEKVPRALVWTLAAIGAAWCLAQAVTAAGLCAERIVVTSRVLLVLTIAFWMLVTRVSYQAAD